MPRNYCKAYYLKDMRQFNDWTEKYENNDEKIELKDDEIVYLWDDFTVVRSPIIPDKSFVFDTVTPSWREFCRTVLKFEIPEDLHYAYEESEKTSAD